MNVFRQGDVLIVQIEDDSVLVGPTAPIKRESERIVLAHGEITGHAHAILEKEANFVLTADNRRILITDVPVQVVHEEHEPISLPAGKFEIIHQVEYTPARMRPVFD